MKKVLLINGSPNQNGNTAAALKIVEDVLNKEDLQTVWFHIGNKPVRGCMGCGRCERTHRCVFDDDVCNKLIEMILAADAMIVGTPVYFAGPNGALCSLLDRVFYATANFGQMLKGKPVSAIATCWRAGATPSIDRLNKYFSFSQMPIVNSEYWNGYLGEEDDFGAHVLKTLAQNIIEILMKEQAASALSAHPRSI